jgi:hypothetical protein
MFSPTKVSSLTVQYLVIDLRCYITNLKGEACPTSGGVRTTVCWPRTLVDTLALITRQQHIYVCEQFCFEDEIQ